MPQTQNDPRDAGVGGPSKFDRASRQDRTDHRPTGQETQPGPYNGQVGHKGDSDTGPAAAKAIARKAPSIRMAALAVIEREPATAEQVAAEIDVHWMVVRARCSELRAFGLIEDSGLRGAGALGGKVILWRSTTPIERAIFLARKAADAEHGPEAAP